MFRSDLDLSLSPRLPLKEVAAVLAEGREPATLDFAAAVARCATHYAKGEDKHLSMTTVNMCKM